MQGSTATESGGAAQLAPPKSALILMGLVLSVVVAIGTYAHGIMTDRWERVNGELLNQFTVQVPKIPLSFGDWEGTEEFISDKEFEATNCTAYISRRYVNRGTGEIVSMYCVSGTARHITIHSPDWCYQGAGYKMQGKPVQYSAPYSGGSSSAEFLTASFHKADVANTGNDKTLRIFWTYSDDGEWIGPPWAKAFFAGRPALYKIYLICDCSGQDTSAGASPANKFTSDLFQSINQTLFAAAPPVAVEAS